MMGDYGTNTEDYSLLSFKKAFIRSKLRLN